MPFDPYRIPAAVTAYMLESDREEQDRVAVEFGRRAVAAKHLLDAAAVIERAGATHPDLGIASLALAVIRKAREIHDYDPASD